MTYHTHFTMRVNSTGETFTEKFSLHDHSSYTEQGLAYDIAVLVIDSWNRAQANYKHQFYYELV